MQTLLKITNKHTSLAATTMWWKLIVSIRTGLSITNAPQTSGKNTLQWQLIFWIPVTLPHQHGKQCSDTWTSAKESKYLLNSCNSSTSTLENNAVTHEHLPRSQKYRSWGGASIYLYIYIYLYVYIYIYIVYIMFIFQRERESKLRNFHETILP